MPNEFTITSIRIPTMACYPGDPVTDHEELMLTLGHLFARIEHLEKVNQALHTRVKKIETYLD